jgi:hypothetical protein
MSYDRESSCEYPLPPVTGLGDIPLQSNGIHPRPPCRSAKERLIDDQTLSTLRGWLMSLVSQEGPRAIEIREWVAQDSRTTPHLVVFGLNWTNRRVTFAVAKASELITPMDLVDHAKRAGLGLVYREVGSWAGM